LAKAKYGNGTPVSYPINSPIFQEANETSSFASFKPTSNVSIVSNAAEWEFNAQQLLPKETYMCLPTVVTLPERNKEEIIFKPSQEQLSGVVRLPEDNWVQTLPKIVPPPVQQKIEPIQEQLTIAPITCGLTNDSTITSATFVRIPESTTEIEQTVKRDLEYLQQNLENHEPFTGITDTETKEDLYTDPYSEYYE
jgi:hypothetical protein